MTYQVIENGFRAVLENNGTVVKPHRWRSNEIYFDNFCGFNYWIEEYNKITYVDYVRDDKCNIKIKKIKSAKITVVLIAN